MSHKSRPHPCDFFSVAEVGDHNLQGTPARLPHPQVSIPSRANDVIRHWPQRKSNQRSRIAPAHYPSSPRHLRLPNTRHQQKFHRNPGNMQHRRRNATCTCSTTMSRNPIRSISRLTLSMSPNVSIGPAVTQFATHKLLRPRSFQAPEIHRPQTTRPPGRSSRWHSRRNADLFAPCA